MPWDPTKLGSWQATGSGLTAKTFWASLCLVCARLENCKTARQPHDVQTSGRFPNPNPNQVCCRPTPGTSMPSHLYRIGTTDVPQLNNGLEFGEAFGAQPCQDEWSTSFPPGLDPCRSCCSKSPTMELLRPAAIHAPTDVAAVDSGRHRPFSWRSGVPADAGGRRCCRKSIPICISGNQHSPGSNSAKPKRDQQGESARIRKQRSSTNYLHLSQVFGIIPGIPLTTPRKGENIDAINRTTTFPTCTLPIV